MNNNTPIDVSVAHLIDGLKHTANQFPNSSGVTLAAANALEDMQREMRDLISENETLKFAAEEWRKKGVAWGRENAKLRECVANARNAAQGIVDGQPPLSIAEALADHCDEVLPDREAEK